MLSFFQSKVALLIVCRRCLLQGQRWSGAGGAGIDLNNYCKNMMLNCCFLPQLRSMASRSVRCYNGAVPSILAAHHDARLERRIYTTIIRET